MRMIDALLDWVGVGGTTIVLILGAFLIAAPIAIGISAWEANHAWAEVDAWDCEKTNQFVWVRGEAKRVWQCEDPEE